MNRVKFIRNDIQDFLLSFDDATVSKIISSLEILDEQGQNLRPPKSKKVAKDIYELRILSNLSVRILYTFCNGHIVVLHAFVKKSPKLPPRELATAVHRLQYLQ